MSARVSFVVLAAAAALSACGQGSGSSASGGDKYAGLDEAIRSWRTEIQSTEPACQTKDGKGCEAFEVVCKAERDIPTAAQAKGETVKVVAAMRWSAWDEGRAESKPASAVAEFSRAGASWTRADAGPVNLSTCASA
jgi:hypothetical protein